MAEDIAEKMRIEAYLLRDQLSILAVVHSVRKALIKGAEEIDNLREQLATCRELRAIDTALIAKLRKPLQDVDK